MQNQYNPKPNTPIVCWKCNTENNLAESTICVKCKCSLQLSNIKTYSKVRKKKSISFLLFKIALLLLVVMTIAGIVAINVVIQDFPDLRAYKPLTYVIWSGSTPQNSNLIPANAWFKGSPRSYIRNYPSLKEILEKNLEVTGTPSNLSNGFQSFSLSGNISASRGMCATTKCFEDYNANLQNANNFEREFKEVGMIETFVKKPAKSLRRIKINLRVDYIKSTEITEAFNQGAGWKETKKTDLQGKISNSVEDLDEIESAKLKIDLDSVLLDSSFNSNDVEFQGVEKINDRITYVITKLNKNQKQEKLYFDSITGQMIKMSVEDMDMYFDNFKKNGNLTMPYTIYYKHKFSNGAMSWMKLEVNEWKLNEEINDSMFEKPKTISPNI